MFSPSPPYDVAEQPAVHVRRGRRRVHHQPDERAAMEKLLRLRTRLLAEAFRVEVHLGGVDLNQADGDASSQDDRVAVGHVVDRLPPGRWCRNLRSQVQPHRHGNNCHKHASENRREFPAWSEGRPGRPPPKVALQVTVLMVTTRLSTLGQPAGGSGQGCHGCARRAMHRHVRRASARPGRSPVPLSAHLRRNSDDSLMGTHEGRAVGASITLDDSGGCACGGARGGGGHRRPAILSAMALSVLVVDASLVNTWIASVVVIGSDVGDLIGCKRATCLISSATPSARGRWHSPGP